MAVGAQVINRPPTGGDLTFSWKEGHICTVVLSQLCHGQLVMGGRWQIAAASDWAGFSMGRGGAAAEMDGTIYAHMPRCCTSAHEKPTTLHRQPSPPLVLMCHRTLLRPAAVLDVPFKLAQRRASVQGGDEEEDGDSQARG